MPRLKPPAGLTLVVWRVALADPLAIAVFAGFIDYQLHRWTLGGSPAMLALSTLDLVVIWLTWQEWEQRRPHEAPFQQGTRLISFSASPRR